MTGLSAALLCSTATCPASESESENPAVLTPHEVRYDVWRRGSKLGELTLTLERAANGEFDYRASTEATSLLTRLLRVGSDESARFAWRDGRIKSLHYQRHTRQPGKQRLWEADFEWAAGRVRRSGDTDEPDAALEDGVIDPLSLRLKIAMALAAEPRPEGDLAFRVLERERIETQIYRPRGYFKLTVPAGCVTALQLDRIQEDEPDRQLHAWHAPALAWLPVRIRQMDGGKEDMDLLLAESSLFDETAEDCE